MDEARELYRGSLRIDRSQLSASPALASRKFAVLALLWPSKKFADKSLIAGGAASADRLRIVLRVSSSGSRAGSTTPKRTPR